MPPEDKKKKKPEEEVREATGSVGASDPDFAEWLMALWEDGQSPQRLELNVVYGPGNAKVGAQVDRKEWRGVAPEPKTEDIVEWSNRFKRAAQRHCDAAGKKTKYEVMAFDDRRAGSKGNGKIAGYPFVLEPANNYAEDDRGGPGGTDDEFGNDFLLRRLDTIQKDHVWHEEHFTRSMGDLTRMYQEECKRLREQVDQLFARNMELAKQLEAALSSAEDRALARDKQRFFLEKVGEGANVVMGLLPTVVNKMAGKQLMPVTMPPEAMVLHTFFKSSTKEQRDKLFGTFDEKTGEQLTPGVLAIQQSLILDGVASNKMPVEHLFSLLEGAEHPITMDQVMGIRSIWSDEQLAPLFVLIKDLNERRAASAAPTRKITE